jgi:D-alanyl-D-alanine carboxypeptidase (penicillin-binding protein 5/6)
VAPKDLQVLVPREVRPGMKARVLYAGPIEAPIARGQKLATLRVEVPGKAPVDFDLVAGADVARGGLMTRIGAAAQLARDRALGYLPGF